MKVAGSAEAVACANSPKWFWIVNTIVTASNVVNTVTNQGHSKRGMKDAIKPAHDYHGQNEREISIDGANSIRHSPRYHIYKQMVFRSFQGLETCATNLDA